MVGINAGPVGEWFDQNIEGARSPLSFELITGGHSNLTYKATDANGVDFVLRRPPTGAVLATAHDMAREYKIIAGVGQTDVPVPDALGLCEDAAVNDAPFYVMNYVIGHVLADSETVDKEFPTSGQRSKISDSVVAILATLHAVNPDDIGLGDLGRKENYVARQLKRWKTQWENSKTRELATMDEVHAELEARIPVQDGAAIVHGDYRLGNMLTNDDAQIAAVLDWELCTLGDPLADLGYVLNNWVQPNEPNPITRGDLLPPTSLGGFSTREAFVERYGELSGRDTSQVAYYRAFQYWRLAAIIEGVMARYLKGVMGDSDEDPAEFKEQIDALAQAGADLLAES